MAGLKPHLTPALPIGSADSADVEREKLLLRFGEMYAAWFAGSLCSWFGDKIRRAKIRQAGAAKQTAFDGRLVSPLTSHPSGPPKPPCYNPSGPARMLITLSGPWSSNPSAALSSFCSESLALL